MTAPDPAGTLDSRSGTVTAGQAAGLPVSASAQAAFDAFWGSPALGEEPPAPLHREALGIRLAWEAAVAAAIGAATRMTPHDIADEAIGLFLEYRDQHGHDEPSARVAAVLEVAEGMAVTDDQLAAAAPAPAGEGGLRMSPRTALLEYLRELVSCESIAADACPACNRRADEVLAVITPQPQAAPGDDDLYREIDGLHDIIRDALTLKWQPGDTLHRRLVWRAAQHDVHDSDGQLLSVAEQEQAAPGADAP